MLPTNAFNVMNHSNLWSSMISDDGSADNNNTDDSCFVVVADPVKDNNINNTIVPNKDDVILSRGNIYRHHPGNGLFDALITSYQEKYMDTSSTLGKRAIVCEIIDKVQMRGRFLKQASHQQWVVVTQKQAQHKVAHALRYQCRRRLHGGGITTKYSSTEAPPRQLHCRPTEKDVDGNNDNMDNKDTLASLLKPLIEYHEREAFPQYSVCDSTRDQVLLKEKPTSQFDEDRMWYTLSTVTDHRSTSSIGSFDVLELDDDDDDEPVTTSRKDNSDVQNGLNSAPALVLEDDENSAEMESVFLWNMDDVDDIISWCMTETTSQDTEKSLHP